MCCHICGAREDLARKGGLVLCRRCLSALYTALGAHFPLKSEENCATITLSDNTGKDG